jgi:SAM-dependent methyltransferase
MLQYFRIFVFILSILFILSKPYLPLSTMHALDDMMSDSRRVDASSIPESSYLGRHAALYDLFYADKPYADEAAFVDRIFRELSAVGEHARPRLLELACGTGRHAIELERLGYDIVATDYSTDMLECAKRRGAAVGARAAFHFADMRRLSDAPPLAEQAFDGVYAMFDSIGYVQTNEAIAEVFAGVRGLLAPGGLFVFEFWHAAAMLRSFDPLRVRRWPTSTGEIVRISQTTIEPARQLSHVSYDILDLRDDGTFERIRETQTNRYFLLQEMLALVARAGFSTVRAFAGFSWDAPIDETTWHVVLAASNG